MPEDKKKEGLGLILTIGEGERITIRAGDDCIEITSLHRKGSGNRIAIKCDKDKFRIDREGHTA